MAMRSRSINVSIHLILELKDLILPFLAGAPPTIRVVDTFTNPHPSSGVNKRPLMSVLGVN